MINTNIFTGIAGTPNRRSGFLNRRTRSSPIHICLAVFSRRENPKPAYETSSTYYEIGPNTLPEVDGGSGAGMRNRRRHIMIPFDHSIQQKIQASGI
jgi:hypothetical protein